MKTNLVQNKNPVPFVRDLAVHFLPDTNIACIHQHPESSPMKQ